MGLILSTTIESEFTKSELIVLGILLFLAFIIWMKTIMFVKRTNKEIRELELKQERLVAIQDEEERRKNLIARIKGC